MSNRKALDLLKHNLWRAMRTWRYAKHRGLSFAKRYANKVFACAQALGLTTVEVMDLAYCHDAVFQGL